MYMIKVNKIIRKQHKNKQHLKLKINVKLEKCRKNTLISKYIIHS